MLKRILLALIPILALTVKAEESLFDPNLAQNAVVVLRVKLIFSHDLDDGRANLTDYIVHTINVLKNESHKDIRDVTVLAFKGRSGVPDAECTIYLQRYDVVARAFSTNNDIGRWILVGGDATNGVSHVKETVERK